MLLLIYCVAMIPFSIYSTMKLAETYNLSAAMFAAARQAVITLQSEGNTFALNPLLDKAPTIAFSTAFILILEENRKWIVAIGIGAAMILGLFSHRTRVAFAALRLGIHSLAARPVAIHSWLWVSTWQPQAHSSHWP